MPASVLVLLKLPRVFFQRLWAIRFQERHTSSEALWDDLVPQKGRSEEYACSRIRQSIFSKSKSTCLCVCVYMCMCVCVCVRERERVSEREMCEWEKEMHVHERMENERKSVSASECMCRCRRHGMTAVYEYVCVCMCMWMDIVPESISVWHTWFTGVVGRCSPLSSGEEQLGTT
jgi:hypothetical protein